MAMRARASSASCVAKPMCGTMTVFGARRIGSSGSNGGSESNTSSPAPAMRPSASAAASASVSIMEPRAVLMSIALGFMRAICATPIIWNVSGTDGTWMVSTSLWTQSSSSDKYVTPSIGREFKVFYADTGLLMSQLAHGTAAQVLRGELGAYKGAIAENMVASAFSADDLVPLSTMIVEPSGTSLAATRAMSSFSS